jgi:4-diphosphocytidyl-2-C-methyl-D-erythritol kinase
MTSLEPREYVAKSKINLGLEILRKRPDGYHDLNTLFYALSEPHDQLLVTSSNAFSLTSSDPSLNLGDSNLIVRAMRAFSERTNTPVPEVHIHLKKNIPIGAGLGGGSSDAATTLRICNDLSGGLLTLAELFGLGAKLGADVNFFLQDTQATLASGIGDVLLLTHLKLSNPILVVKPMGISISTKEAYADLQLESDRHPTDLVHPFRDSDHTRLRSVILNDMERGAFVRHPELQVLKQQLYDLGAYFALMSGSGSSLFGIFANEDLAKRAQVVLRSGGNQVFLNLSK